MRALGSQKNGWFTVLLVILHFFVLNSSATCGFQPLSSCYETSRNRHRRREPSQPGRYRYPTDYQTLSRHTNKAERFLFPRHLKPLAQSSLLLPFSIQVLPFRASTPFFSAFLALTASTTAGLVSDNLLSSNIGVLVALVTAALLSNLASVPASHPLYNLCWTLFLPASLALLLLSSSEQEDASSPLNDHLTIETIKNMAVPFVVASTGSILGCTLSFLVCLRWPTLWLTPYNASLAASCLCASYIGGSVNFFATAHALTNTSSAKAQHSSLLGSMAAADLMVMAVYFAFLTAALRWKPLLSMFDCNDQGVENEISNDESRSSYNGVSNQYLFLQETTSNGRMQKALATVLVATLAFATVQTANRIEATLATTIGLPGTACAVIALLTTSMNQYMSPRSSTLWTIMQGIAGPVSRLCFFMLFASIGMSANVGNALRAGPACLWFSAIALLVHVIVTLGGSLLCKWTLNSNIELQHVLVASNAAIGGPATAAAFCGQIQPRRKGLTLAATIWGVVGYATGTGIGILLSRLLISML